MTAAAVLLLTVMSLHIQYRIYRAPRPCSAPTEGGDSHRSEMRPSVSQ